MINLIVFIIIFNALLFQVNSDFTRSVIPAAPIFDSYYMRSGGVLVIRLNPSYIDSGFIYWYFVTVQSKRMPSCFLWRYNCYNCYSKDMKYNGESIEKCVSDQNYNLTYFLSTNFSFPWEFNFTLPKDIIPGREYILHAQAMNKWGYGSVAAVRYFYHHDCKTTLDGYAYRGTVNKYTAQCQTWTTVQRPYSVVSDLGQDFCRNPGYSAIIFCFHANYPLGECPVKFCPEECTNGSSYLGLVSITRYGHECQDWSSQTPHYNPVIGEHGNFCRYKMGFKYPWCFTTNPAVNYDICDIKECYAECKNTKNGSDYLGTQNITALGFQCQRWNADKPHKSLYKGLESNYCRNPDGYYKPWCYTTNPNVYRDVCDIKLCAQDCFHVLYGTDYNGNWEITITSKICVMWASVSKVEYRHLRENYCRNPDKKPEGPWCYISMSFDIWEYCGLHMCNDENLCLDRFVYQSTAVQDKLSLVYYEAYIAVDGFKDTEDYFSETLYNRPPHWWRVAFDESTPIRICLIYNRDDHPEYLVDSIVELLDIDLNVVYVCGSLTKTQLIYTVDCANYYGDYLIIRHDKLLPLSLKEVECFAQQRSMCRNKAATQSSDYKIYSADLAVDGHYVEGEANVTCSRIVNDSEPWWMVDLGREYLIDVVSIYGFEDDTSLIGARVVVINSNQNLIQSCGWLSNVSPFKISCDYADGRFIKIYHSSNTSLTLCEVDCSGKLKGYVN